MSRKFFPTFLTFLLVLPMGFLSAHSSITHNESLQENYCLRVVVFEVENNRRVAEIQKAMVDKESEIIEQYTAVLKEQDRMLAAYKQKFNEAYAAHFSDLSKSSEAKKVKMLQDEYVATFDAVILEYRSAVKNAIQTRKQAYVALESKFLSRVSEILAKTKADCNAKSDVKQIFSYLTTELKAAHIALVASLVELSKVETPVLNTAKLAQAKEIFNTGIITLLNSYERENN